MFFLQVPLRPWQAGEGNQNALTSSPSMSNNGGKRPPEWPLAQSAGAFWCGRSSCAFGSAKSFDGSATGRFSFRPPVLWAFVHSCQSSFSSQPFWQKIFCNFLSAPVTLSLAQLPLIPSSAAISRKLFLQGIPGMEPPRLGGDRWVMASARCSNSSSSAASSISRIIKSSGDCTKGTWRGFQCRDCNPWSKRDSSFFRPSCRFS